MANSNDQAYEDAVKALAGFMAEAVSGSRDTEMYEGARRMAERFLRDEHLGLVVASRQSAIRAKAVMDRVEEAARHLGDNITAFPVDRIVRVASHGGGSE